MNCTKVDNFVGCQPNDKPKFSNEHEPSSCSCNTLQHETFANRFQASLATNDARAEEIQMEAEDPLIDMGEY